MSIGEVARQAGLRASTIRFYERAGLLPKPVRAGGRRRYDRTVLERLAVVGRAKDCGFTLDEVRHLFNSEGPPSERWQCIARNKIAELDALANRIVVMKELLERRCRCKDLGECGRRILDPR